MSRAFIGFLLALYYVSSAHAAIELAVEANPDSVQPNETINAQLTVTNTSNAVLPGVTLRLRYPDWLLTLNNSLIWDAGECPGGSWCDFGLDEFVTWNLGDVPGGGSRTVTLPPTVWNGTPEGTLITLGGSVREGDDTQASSSDTVFVGDIITKVPEPPDDPIAIDNCTEIPNSDQCDTNNDGFGNVCDPDLNNDGIVNAADLALLRAVFFTNDADADFDGDGNVNAGDLAIMRSFFFKAPGPSAAAP